MQAIIEERFPTSRLVICIKDEIMEYVNAVGQLSAIPTSENTARLYPLCRQLFVVILVIIMSISVVLDTKATAVGITSIVFLVHRVIFKKIPRNVDNKIWLMEKEGLKEILWITNLNHPVL